MKLNAALIVLGGATIALLGLWALVGDDPSSVWMALGACAMSALALGFAQSGPEFKPMAIGFAVFAVAHVICAFDDELVAIVLSAGLVVVIITSIVTGIRRLRDATSTGAARYLPLVAGCWGVTIPVALAVGGDSAHHTALIVYGLVWATLGAVLSTSDTRQPVLV